MPIWGVQLWLGYMLSLIVVYQLHSYSACSLSVFLNTFPHGMQKVLPSSSRKRCLQNRSVQKTPSSGLQNSHYKIYWSTLHENSFQKLFMVRLHTCTEAHTYTFLFASLQNCLSHSLTQKPRTNPSSALSPFNCPNRNIFSLSWCSYVKLKEASKTFGAPEFLTIPEFSLC